MKKRIGYLIFLSVCIFGSKAQETSTRPKIGVTLSGGGAKGLAHIGILKAIDSAGLNVDYITGTSMGSIMGSLYAIGYSGKELEQIVKRIDWDLLLSNSSSLQSLIMEEKEEYGKYALELPWVNSRFQLPSGVLESEELWLKFAELYFPVYNIKDFSKFSIPFKCLAADIATGEAVVLSGGEIVTAVRASMAIPSVFTAVEIDNRKLVDGGVVRNFPVRDVREMGANIVIGSNVTTGLLPKEKVNNALQVLLQLSFFKESEDAKKEVDLCDIYIPVPVLNYSTASFGKSREILEIGLAEGDRMYPVFKRLADSLNAIYGPPEIKGNRLPRVDSIFISDIDIRGLKNTTADFFTHMMGFYTNKYYTPQALARRIRRIFGTRYYNRILYSLEPASDSSARIVFNVEENPRSFAKLGIHFNKFTGIGVIANLTTRNFFAPHSRSMLTLHVGEMFRIKGEHLQYLGRGKNVAAILGTQYDYLTIPTFTDYKKDGEYKQDYFKGEMRLQVSSNRSFTLGMGSRFEWVSYKPSIITSFDIKGKNEFFTSFLYWKLNTLDRAVLPRRGLRIESEGGYVYNQSPDVSVFINGQEIDQDSLGISYNSYQRLIFNLDGYIPLGKRTTLTSQFQTGINFNYAQNVFNDFIIGGLTRTIRNQILFAGLEEGSFFTPSVAALQLGTRVNFNNNLYGAAQINGLMKNFLNSENLFESPEYLTGYSVTLGYNFALGPLELSIMYCDQSKKVVSYVNLGIPF